MRRLHCDLWTDWKLRNSIRFAASSSSYQAISTSPRFFIAPAYILRITFNQLPPSSILQTKNFPSCFHVWETLTHRLHTYNRFQGKHTAKRIEKVNFGLIFLNNSRTTWRNISIQMLNWMELSVRVFRRNGKRGMWMTHLGFRFWFCLVACRMSHIRFDSRKSVSRIAFTFK